MKLISLNVEGKKHTEIVFSFLMAEQADVVCLQEAPEDWCPQLQSLGYQTTFAPMLIRTRNETHVEGVIFASKKKHDATTEYYYKSAAEVTDYTKGEREKLAHPVIIGSVILNDITFSIATTHFMVTKDGLADDHQRQGLEELLKTLAPKENHILCGDFNMPRSVNTLYPEVTKIYTDTVPDKFSSSLDRNIHRLGSSTTLNEPIFDSYMVDYIFTQEPYVASDVRLVFGLSDHAAVVGNITVIQPSLT